MNLSCQKNTTTDTYNEPQLLFKSGFEEGVSIDTTAYPSNEDYRYITGTDIKTGFTWPISILGASNSALHYISDDNHQAVSAELQKTIGPTGDSTIVLHQRENYISQGDTQCPYEILNITEGKKDLYVRFWMKLDSSGMHLPDKWRALFEYKTKDYAAGTGYRFIAFVYTDVNGNPYWHIQGDKNPENPIWQMDNFDIKVPENKWFLTEFYWKWSDHKDGRTLWKINKQIIADHTGATTRNGKPIDFIMLTQIYGDGNPKEQWIDDIEIWDSLIDN